MFKGYNDYHVGKMGAAVHDVCTIYYLTHPEYIKTEKAFIEIKYYKTETDDFGYVDIDFDKKTKCNRLRRLRHKYVQI